MNKNSRKEDSMNKEGYVHLSTGYKRGGSMALDQTFYSKFRSFFSFLIDLKVS